MLVETVRGWWTAVKLRRGQCRECSRPLRDDVTVGDRFCCDECHDEWHSRNDW